MHAGLIALHALPSILVGPDGLILHLSTQAGRFLIHPPGRVTANLTKLVREELSGEVLSAMHAARHDRRPVRTRYLPVQLNGESPLVSVQVRPAMDPQYEGYSLVVFDEIVAPPSGALPDGTARRTGASPILPESWNPTATTSATSSSSSISARRK
jgi:two-component system CheB/CheR fusion protein